MNFSRSSIERKRKDNTGAKAGRAAGFLVVKVLFLCLAAAAVVAVCGGVGMIRGLIASAPDISNLSVTPSETATYIYAQDGTVMQRLTLPTSNRTLVTLDQIPEDLQHAVVAIEDERFYTHHGIDVQGIIRAFVVGVTRAGKAAHQGRNSGGLSEYHQPGSRNLRSAGRLLPVF